MMQNFFGFGSFIKAEWNSNCPWLVETPVKAISFDSKPVLKKSVVYSTIILGVFLIFSTGSFSQFRVVGYMQPWNEEPDLSKISFQNLTHLTIAYVGADSVGNLMLPTGFNALVKKAQESKIKVTVSVGSNKFTPFFSGISFDTNLKLLVEQLVKLTDDNKLDGIDLNVEGDAINKFHNRYDHLVASLSAALKPTNKLLTAAFSTWCVEGLANATLKKFDFISVLSYDQTGAWNQKEPGQHSTYAKAEEDLLYWTVTRGFSKKKLNLAIPFFGYGFGIKDNQYPSYGDIVTTYPGSEQTDMFLPETGGIIYYNGIQTIKNKTALAIKNAGGVTAWQLQQDGEGDKSLLNAIDAEVKNNSAKK